MWVVSVTSTLHMSLESSLVVRGVVNNAVGAISLIQSVLSLHNISITMFPGALVVIIALVACLAVVIAATDEHHSHPKYKFEYGVKDGHTHDHKSAWEHRDGDVVKGQYTLDEADGTHRVVDYTSDHKTGFQAHVQRTGHAHHPHGESYTNIDQHH
ncbi:larval cuticle protein A2B-like [Ochlerotatus camptorhynchus]|uniref:larval cuticle protein A2B-like n=1 Tax=Ochlerotatus camptorhynchus TaxID=644619 RepID=UPI0031D595CB